MKAIEVLLLENVENLGLVGEVVRVKPGYARNFLLPFGLATAPTAGLVKRLESRRAQAEAEMKRRRAQLEQMAESIEGYEITLERASNEQGILFGGVSQHDIAQSLRESGFQVEDRNVRIGQQIKRVDTYDIPVVLASDLKCEIKLNVVSDRPLATEDQEQEFEEAEAAEAAEGAETQAEQQASPTQETEPAARARTEAG